MELELATFEVRELRLGSETAFRGGVLTICPDALARILSSDSRLSEVGVDVARPGDAVRIVHILDAVEPRTKARGDGACFPGILGGFRGIGTGRTHRLGGVGVLEASELPVVPGEVPTKEAIVDMSGPGAVYSPFATLQNVVLTFRFTEGLSRLECDAAARLATLRTADYLAASAREATPDRVERFVLSPPENVLPRVLAITLLTCDGATHQNYLYGQSVASIAPTLLHPNVLFDGAVVNGSYLFASLRNPTYFHQNHPVSVALYRQHGISVDFRGVLVGRNLWPSFADKERSAECLGTLAATLGAQAAVINLDGAGHGVADLMLACRACEARGIRTTLLMLEMAGEEGTDLGLVDPAREADAIVSCGNMDEVVSLPPMPRVLGGARCLDVGGEAVKDQPTDGELKVPLRAIFAATTQLGGGLVRAREF